METFWSFFVLDTIKTTFWMDNITQRCTPSRPSFPKSGHFFWFSKRAGKVSPLPPSWVPVSVPEYGPISLNMSKYSYNCLNKLFLLCQGFEYAWSSYMFDRILKMPRVLNRPGFICKALYTACICKGYAEFRIFLIMSPYASIMPKYA